MKKIVILISGRGSNMAALIDAARLADFPAEIVAVISNRADAAGPANYPPPPVVNVPVVPPPAATAAQLGVRAGPAIDTLNLSGGRATSALRSFFESCPRLLARSDNSGLTRGAVREVVGVVSFVAAVLVSLAGLRFSGPFFRGFIDPPWMGTTLAVLAVFVQTVVPHKMIGWALMLAWVVSTLVMGALGFEHNLASFASLPTLVYSDMNGYGHFLAGWSWFALFWSLVTVALLILAQAFWVRGLAQGWHARFMGAMRGLNGLAGLSMVLCLAACGATASWILYNTHALNNYQSKAAELDAQAEHETGGIKVVEGIHGEHVASGFEKLAEVVFDEDPPVGPLPDRLAIEKHEIEIVRRDPERGRFDRCSPRDFKRFPKPAFLTVLGLMVPHP